MRVMKITLPALLLIIIVMFAGWSLAFSSQPQPFPFSPPAPSPLVKRPAVRWVVHAAKSLLWVMAFAEEKPRIVQGTRQTVVDTTATLVKSGDVPSPARKIDWSEGW